MRYYTKIFNVSPNEVMRFTGVECWQAIATKDVFIKSRIWNIRTVPKPDVFFSERYRDSQAFNGHDDDKGTTSLKTEYCSLRGAMYRLEKWARWKIWLVPANCVMFVWPRSANCNGYLVVSTGWDGEQQFWICIFFSACFYILIKAQLAASIMGK